MNGQTILVLADGTWGNKEMLHALVAQVDLVIAANGAWSKAQSLGIPIAVVVGDLDSLTTVETDALRASETETLVHPREKDQTDLELALDYALATKPKRIILHGVLGSRLDQSLSSIFLLEKVMRTGILGEIVTDQEHIHLVMDRLELNAALPGDIVSFLPVTEEVMGIRTWGLKYPLQGERLYRISTRGISNEVIALPVGVSLQEGLLLVCHRGGSPEEIKLHF